MEKTTQVVGSYENKLDLENISVIIQKKQADCKESSDTLERAIKVGYNHYKTTTLSMLFSSISAGLILGFSVLGVAFAYQLIGYNDDYFVKKLVMSAFYPLGFILCVLGGTQLFTEHTALSFYPYLDKLVGLSEVIRMWLVILIGNIIGTILCSLILYITGPITKTGEAYVTIAKSLLLEDYLMLFVSAIMAGWLMALGNWLLQSTTHMISKMVSIYLVTFIIGIGGFHHSIVGSAELFVGKLFEPSLDMSIIVYNLAVIILGNLVGGSMLVALLNYTHIKKFN